MNKHQFPGLMQKLSLVLFLSACLITSSCRKDDNHHCEVFEWGYEDEEDPAHWGTCFMTCSGTTQSPIGIRGAVIDQSLTALAPQYQNASINMHNTGHSLQMDYPAGSTLQFNGVPYSLLQFHFHFTSEHTIAGKSFPLEMHLVHRNEATGNHVVVGVLLEEGIENTSLQLFADQLPATLDQHYISTDTINSQQLLPGDPGYYTYPGSLTTPPCTEMITWIVMKTPIQASSAQIQKFKDVLHNNARPIQPLAGRMIREYQ